MKKFLLTLIIFHISIFNLFAQDVTSEYHTMDPEHNLDVYKHYKEVKNWRYNYQNYERTFIDVSSIKLLSKHEEKYRLGFLVNDRKGGKKLSSWTLIQLNCKTPIRRQFLKLVYYLDHDMKGKGRILNKGNIWLKEYSPQDFANNTTYTNSFMETIDVICKFCRQNIQKSFPKVKKNQVVKETPKTFDIEKASKTCLDLGFKKGTKKYKNCIIELL